MAALDHIVVNVLHDMDAAAACFTALGFALTPLGRHSLGSINHLMMTPAAYLELVGVPETGPKRPDVLDSPFGLNGLVLRSADADATASELHGAGIPALPPMAFSRPVEIDGHVAEARFRTVRIPTEVLPAGRVYYCEHLTPDLVWRREWLTHPNGFCGIDSLVIVSPDPAAESARYAAACGASASETETGWRICLEDAVVELVGGAAPRFESLGLRFSTLEDLARRVAGRSDVEWHRRGPAVAAMTIPAFDLRLDCRTAA